MVRHKTVRIEPAQSQFSYCNPREHKAQHESNDGNGYDSDQELADLGYGSEDEVEVGVAQIAVRVGPGTAYPIRIVDIAPRRNPATNDMPLRRVDGVMDLRATKLPVPSSSTRSSDHVNMMHSYQFKDDDEEPEDIYGIFPARIDSAMHQNIRRNDAMASPRERIREDNTSFENLHKLRSLMYTASDSQLQKTAKGFEKLSLCGPSKPANTDAELEGNVSPVSHGSSPDAVHKLHAKLRKIKPQLPKHVTSNLSPVRQAEMTSCTASSLRGYVGQTLKGRSRSKRSLWPLNSIANRHLVRETDSETSDVISERSPTQSVDDIGKGDG